MEALFLLGVFALVVQGVVYWIYHTFRETCLNNAGQFVPHSVAMLFAFTFLSGIVFAAGVVLAMGVLSCFACPFYLAAIFYGIHGWIELYQDVKTDREERQRVLLKFPVPKLQFRIFDLMVAAFAFGLVLTILTNYVFPDERVRPQLEGKTALVVAGILAMEAVAFFIAMDVMRRSAMLQFPVPRMLYLLMVLLLGVIPPVFPILILSWHVWRYSVWKVQVYR